MRKVVLLLMLMGAFFASKAQTFTVATDDGTEITYSVVNEDTVIVGGIQNYSSRIIVPQTVNYDGTTYTVARINHSVFSNKTGITYIQLPATIERMGNNVFYNCGNLDTLELMSAFPPKNLYGNDFIDQALLGQLQTINIVVPVGRLSAYRTTIWSVLPLLTTAQAHPLYFQKDKKQLMRLLVNSAVVFDSQSPDGYYDIDFEVGDNVYTYVIINSDTAANNIFIGWNNGTMGDFYFSETDTLSPVMQPMGYETMAVNNVSTPVTFNGRLGYYYGAAHYMVPANGNSSSLFANGLWICGLEEGMHQVYVDAMRFNMGDYAPGPINSNYNSTFDIPYHEQFNRVWSVSRSEIDDFIAHVGQSDYTIPENILTWPGNGAEGYAEQLAPYYDANGDGKYNPHNGDYPLIRGDRMTYSIFNDVSLCFATQYRSMGMEVHVSTYAFDEPNDPALNNTIFQSYRIINRSPLTYNDSYLAMFCDFDLGYAYDDYIGSDVRRGMVYCYNGLETDSPGQGYYSGIPPAQGMTVLGGPLLPSDGMDNPKIDIEKMRLYYSEQLAQYLNADGVSYDTAALTADANSYYPEAWYFSTNDLYGNMAINGSNFGNGIADDERIGMTRFVYYENSVNGVNGEPASGLDYFYYMRGQWKNGSQIVFGGNGVGYGEGTSCNFMYPSSSDPWHWGTNGVIPSENADNWAEAVVGNTPGDRRGIASCGPFTMTPGSENVLDIAFTTAFGTTDAWSSVESLGYLSDEVRRQFNHDTTDSGKPFTYRPYSAPIVGIENVATLPALRVYPNPAKGYVNVNIVGSGFVEIFDMRGKMVKRVECTEGVNTIDISTLGNGIYIIRSGSAVNRIVKM